ncbi:helix-turn-helix transcriptional regulator [Kordiimonas pumila]|uniref:Helix-turn-helix transcriptional regulator n=1 Tax=Kordiimonas pumila TaxID=2161677 RepID=A0ABV7D7T2_9PROT|nr:AraC family transcriptional regulator [Kordiimonas pumila]
MMNEACTIDHNYQKNDQTSLKVGSRFSDVIDSYERNFNAYHKQYPFLDSGVKNNKKNGTYIVKGHYPSENGSLNSNPYEYRLYEFNDSFGMIVTKCAIDFPCTIEVIGSGWIALQFRLSGQTLDQFSDSGEQQICSGPCIALYTLPEGTKKTVSFDGPQYVQAVTVFFRNSFLKDRMASFPAEAQKIAEHLKPHSKKIHMQIYPMMPALQKMLKSIITDTSDPSINKLLAEAKCLELLANFIQTGELFNEHDERSIKLSLRDKHCLQEAKDFLAQNFTAPPTLMILARMVGVNRRKLAQGFKQVYGETVYQFCIRKRMTHGYELIRHEGLSITAAALEVGYSDPGSFSKTFKQYYGTSPKNAHQLFVH